MLLVLIGQLSVASGCADVGLNCNSLLGGGGWSNQCNTKYTNWSQAEYDPAGNALNGRTVGEVCPSSCARAPAATQSGSSSGSKKACEEWMASDLSYAVETTTREPRPEFALSDGSKVFAECTPKKALSQSIEAQQHVSCTKDEVIYNEHKCNQYQQYCDWTYTGFPSSNEYKRLPERELFAETMSCLDGQCPQVDPSRYSANFGLFPPAKKDFNWHALDKNGEVLKPRPSKWVMWHYDTLTAPAFTLTNCDCLESTKVEGPKGWFTNSECDAMCSREAIGDPNKLYKVITVHDKVCHREVDVDGVRWDPSPNMNYLTPLDKLFPTRFGPGEACPGPDCIPGLSMQRGEGGTSWYWWAHAKNSWNKNDQTSHAGAGEMTFDSEHECKAYASTYWEVKKMGIDFQSVCDHFSSKTPCASESGANLVTNATCSAACDGTDSSFDDYFRAEGLIKVDGSATEKLGPWFRDNCVYTPYQPENDHAWPNFYVPDINQCFSQWQIGFEDQGCDACMHPLYDNSDAFSGGWSYKPIEGHGVGADPEGYGNCSAQCGKIIMERPGEPKDVKTAQECQQYCQEDPNCAYFQYRPIPDWDKAAESSWVGNKLNQVRSCLLKNNAQVEGSLRARWGADGEWIWHPEQDGHAFANQYQNNDCAQGQTGEAHNWCMGCEDDDGQVTYHSWKWRNNMISGPKFCDVPKIEHGSTDRLDSPYFDSSVTPMKISNCPKYDKGDPNPTPATDPKFVDSDGTPAVVYCKSKEGVEDLNGGAMWAEHCQAANRMSTVKTQQTACERFQQYCDWIIDFRVPLTDYKRITEKDLGIDNSKISVNQFSSSFAVNPPCEEVCTPKEQAVLDPSTAGVCVPPETCDLFYSSVGGYYNDDEDRSGQWVFAHHEKLGSLSNLGCDCLEDPLCSPQCDSIAFDADILKMYFLADRVCHREQDVMGTRFDPSPNMKNLTSVYEDQWGSLGMVNGESGSSWYWYGASKPSWNNWDQTSHVGVGEKKFATEHECRAYATAYWNSMGYSAFDSVCKYMSSKTPGIPNAACHAACDANDLAFESYVGDIGDIGLWFKTHCEYTPYQAENDHAWPSVYVPEANQCFAQWQIGYEDQGCDGCMHRQYNNTIDFDFGWSYAPVAVSGIDEDATGSEDDVMGIWNRGHCSAQCGKVITNDDGTFVDVKTAQDCQNYCQSDDRCVQWQWRFTPDYTAAASVDDNGYVNENNRVNKVRSCLLKNTEQVMGALEARWTADGQFVDGSSPDWDGESDWAAGAPYNSFSSGQFQINDSQASRSGEGNNWYLQCKDSSDLNTAGQTSIKSFKWRNNIVSGPKYCAAAGTGRIAHGASIPASPFLGNQRDTLTTCPTKAQIEFGLKDAVIAPTSAESTPWPVLNGVPPKTPPAVPELYQPWKEPSTTAPGISTRAACDIMDYKHCETYAWEDACLKAAQGSNMKVAGCAIQCEKRIRRVLSGESHMLTALDWMEKFAAHDKQWSVDNCNYDFFPFVHLETTSTTTTTAAIAKLSHCAHTTTSTTTTTEKYVPWEPMCPEGSLEPVSNDSCTKGNDLGGAWTGYIPTLNASRDGSYTSSHDGRISVEVARPMPSWCLSSLSGPFEGVHEAHDFYLETGMAKLACVGWTEIKHDAARAKSLAESTCEAKSAEVFSYRSLAKAVGYFPDFLGYNNLKQNQLDLASFLAHSATETTGGALPNIVGFAWCFAGEQGGGFYGDQASPGCPSCDEWGYTSMIGDVSTIDRSEDNWGYHGRGALQLTHAFNYGAFQKWAQVNLAYSISDIDFMRNPGKISTEDFGFAASVWFYMSPERSNAKPSMHNVVDGWVKDGQLVTFDTINTDNVGRNGDLGYQINVLNGGYECNNGINKTSPPKRVGYFSYFLDKMAFEGDLSAINSICKGCSFAPTVVNANAFQFWYNPVTSAVSGGDTLNQCSGEGSILTPVTEAPVVESTIAECIPELPPFLTANAPAPECDQFWFDACGAQFCKEDPDSPTGYSAI